MRIVKLICLSAILYVVPVNSQDVEFQGGVNISNKLGNGSPSEFKTGILLGTNFYYNIINNYHISFGLNYSQMGSVENSIGTSTMGLKVYNTTNNFNYFDIPVKLGRIYGERITVIPQFGLLNSFLLGTKSKTSIGDTLLIDKNDIEDARFFNFGPIMEIKGGYKINSYIELVISVACKYYFTNLFSKNNMYNLNQHFYGFSFSSGVRVNLVH